MIDTTSASVAEARRIHQLVKHRKFPPGMKPTRFEVTFGEDATGRPAVWIRIPVEAGYQNPSGAWISQARSFVEGLRDDLLKAKLRHWPYIDLIDSKAAE